MFSRGVVILSSGVAMFGRGVVTFSHGVAIISRGWSPLVVELYNNNSFTDTVPLQV